MAKLLRQNVGGVDYTMAGCALTGVCASSASDFVKAVTLSDGDQLSDGMSVVVTFANGNTAGNAPVPLTIYSSDQTNYYSDSGLTQPFTLAPAGCYDLEYTGSGNAYSYISYPVIQAGGVAAPLCNAQGIKASGAVWLAGDKVTLLYKDDSFIVIPQAGDTLTVTAASTTVYGKPLRTGSTVRIMFTADIVGANTSSALTLSYNGVSIPVKVGKNGVLSGFTASEVSSGVYKYLQAYTTLELMYDGTQFVIIGTPVVLSSADYTIYADGHKIKILRRKEIEISGSDVSYHKFGDIYQCTVLINNNFGANELENCSVLDSADYSSWIMNYGLIEDKIQVRIGRPSDTSGYAVRIIFYYYS